MRSADLVLIVRGSVIVNPRVITSSPRAARGSISAEVHAVIIANAQATNVIYCARACVYYYTIYVCGMCGPDNYYVAVYVARS